MTIDYKIDENDFLTHQLYIASQSDQIKKKRQRSKIRVPLIYITCGLILIFLDDYSMGITFFIIAPLWYILYPIWEKKHYIKHFKGFINENYKDRIGKTTTLEINNEYMISKDNGSESKVLTSELEEITEIPTTILMRLKNGHSLILPKDKINDLDALTSRLKELATHLNINYKIDDKWEWK